MKNGHLKKTLRVSQKGVYAKRGAVGPPFGIGDACLFYFLTIFSGQRRMLMPVVNLARLFLMLVI